MIANLSWLFDDCVLIDTKAWVLQVRLEDINLFPDTTGADGTREAGAMKYKEKGGPGYALQKVNADR